MGEEQQVFDWWLKTGSVYGLGWVLLAGVCIILLYGAWRVMRIAIAIADDVRIWLPTWFRGGVETQKAIVDNAKTQTETMQGMKNSHDRTHDAVTHAVRAAASFARRNKDSVGSDVIIHLENAEKSLDQH